MVLEDEEVAQILRAGGFPVTPAWMSHAKRLSFKRTTAERLVCCTDCGTGAGRSLGAYVYYSHLVQLIACPQCGLWYTDVRLAPGVVSAHFEVAYKDEEYFRSSRRWIYDELTFEISRVAPLGGTVLDFGGAKGHLMSILREKRPDLRVVVSDLSRTSVEYAQQTFGFDTIVGGLTEVVQSGMRFDVIVAADVLYYVPNLRDLFAALPGLLSPTGALVVRVPHKARVIRLAAAITAPIDRLLGRPPRVPFLNPEHIFVLGRHYLADRFKAAGWPTTRFVPSPPLGDPRGRPMRRALYLVAKVLNRWLPGSPVLTPALVGVFTRDPIAPAAR